MSRATYPLKLPNSIKKAAQRLAKEDGVSLNQWTAAAKGSGLLKFLRKAPNTPPAPEDRLP